MAGTAKDQDLLRCPRCGAGVEDANAGYCTCCGSSLGMGGRTFGGERAPLRMSPGLGLDERASRPRPQAGPARPSAEVQGFGAVRAHPEFAQWTREQPAGLSHVLGLALFVALGLGFAVLALSGGLRFKHGGQNEYVIALVAGMGLVFAGFGGWMLLRFYRAPILHRVARVADERERTVRTKRGWRTVRYATFEFEDRTRAEFRVSTQLAERITRGDCGLLISRDDVLLEFHRAGRV